MRKLLIPLLIILILPFFQTEAYFAHASSKYARIETTTPIFKTTSGSENLDNIYCLAEESYFVEILGEFENYYRVNYNNISGYAKKNDVKEIINTPSTPYPYNIKIIINSNCNLRSSPTTNSKTNNVISTIYKNSSDIIFIGRTLGEEAIDFGGNTWYFVCYNGQYGYIYNNYIQSITPIYKSTEEFTYATPKIEEIINPITHTPSLIIIIFLMIPLFGVFFILYLPKKTHKHNKTPKAHKNIERY